MTAQMNHVYIFCTAVGTLFTSLPPGLRMFSALKLPKEGSLPSFDGAQDGSLRWSSRATNCMGAPFLSTRAPRFRLNHDSQ